MDTPAGHYSVFRVPFQIDADGDCTRCGLKIEPDEDPLEPHECPPGFTDPAMSGSKGLQRYNGVEQDDEGAYVYYDEHIAALRRAKAEGAREAIKVCRDRMLLWQSHGGAKLASPYSHLTIEGECQVIINEIDARAAQIEEGE